MKHFYNKLSIWWFATMAPAYGSMATIQEREVLRKRRHFSVLMLITFIAVLLFAFQGIFNGAPAIQQIINFGGSGFVLILLWINQRGYLKSASLLHYTTLFLGMAMQMDILSQGVPILSLFQWAMLLLIPVSAGLFLPVWGPLLVTSFEMGFMLWFELKERQTQIASFITDPSVRVQFLFFSLTLISVMGILSTIYALTTTRAVIQADRAVELEQAHQTISQAYATLEVAHQQLETAHATIQKQALTDGLTGLPNHRAIVDQLNKELKRAQRYKRPFSLLFFDGDRFKKVNDTYGHAAGDTVLCLLGERAASVLRSSDTLGRFGGEEFVVLLPEADAQEAAIVAERIRATVAAEPMALSEVEGGLSVTVSIGLASYPADGTSEQDLLTQADEAMYVAKRLGRNQVRSAEEARQMSADIEMLALLQQAEQRDAAEREGTTSEQLRETYTLRTVYSLIALLERRDAGLNAHVHAVSDVATSIANTMGLPTQEITQIGMAALLHDIGKVAIPDLLLQKATSLSPHERTLLQEHSELGAQILEANPFLHDLMPAVRSHHERWDGQGYPDQLAGEDIPLAARIIAVAEAYDAMLRDYPYQAGRSPQEALTELQREAGLQFDPAVVKAFSALVTNQQEMQATRSTSPMSILSS